MREEQKEGNDWPFNKNPRSKPGGHIRIGTRSPKMVKQSFGKHEKILKRSDYLRIYQNGVRVDSENFIIISCQNRSGVKRLGLTASKKTGNSVKRNRIKRLLREFFRLNKDRFPASQDTVIIVKKNIFSLKHHDVCRELENLLIHKTDVQ